LPPPALGEHTEEILRAASLYHNSDPKS